MVERSEPCQRGPNTTAKLGPYLGLNVDEAPAPEEAGDVGVVILVPGFVVGVAIIVLLEGELNVPGVLPEIVVPVVVLVPGRAVPVVVVLAPGINVPGAVPGAVVPVVAVVVMRVPVPVTVPPVVEAAPEAVVPAEVLAVPPLAP
jgi:hypothetical protein